jgi:hypothetical protein
MQRLKVSGAVKGLIKQRHLTAWCVELQRHAFFNFTRDGGGSHTAALPPRTNVGTLWIGGNVDPITSLDAS